MKKFLYALMAGTLLLSTSCEKKMAVDTKRMMFPSNWFILAMVISLLWQMCLSQ